MIGWIRLPGASLVILSTLIAVAQELPQMVRQGETIRVSAAANAVSARMGNRTIQLFPHENKSTGLMPVEVNQAPGPQHLSIFDAAGRVIEKHTITVEHVAFETQNIVISPSKKQVKPSPDEMQTVAALRKSVTPQRFWVEPFTRPTDDCMNSPFGVRRLHNGAPTGRYHQGLDQRSGPGVPVRAITHGAVRIVRMFNVHGGTVGIDHGQGMASFYLHLSRFNVEEGVTVRSGDVIGYVGSTGFATGPHLHWQLSVNGVPVNPHQWVSGIDVCPAEPPQNPARKNRGSKRRV